MVKYLPAQPAHKVADILLSIYSKTAGNKKPPEWRPLHWKNLYFPNPLAPAGGIDKSAKHLKAWWALGAGFIEVGTVTPLPQKKNIGPTLKRDWDKKILWNHLGFPNEGALAVQKRLKSLKNFRPTPIFANIGKNRTTPNDSAHTDYLKCISILHPYVDGFVINISSPNTKDLTDLTKPPLLKHLLCTIRQKLNSLEQPKPFLIKWMPDMEEEDFLTSLDIALAEGAEGHIISNTSSKREKDLIGMFPEYGGISGTPLTAISKQRLVLARKHLGSERKKQLIISVGGALTPEDIFERLNLGADLVQSYSALVFYGPFFLRKVFQATKGIPDH